MTSLVFSKVLGTQIPDYYDPATHIPSKDRLEILKSTSPGVLITALMDHLDLCLFTEPGQPRQALPIGEDNEICSLPDQVRSVFLVKKSTLITPLTDAYLTLATLQEFRPHLSPSPTSDETFIFTVDGFEFESSLLEAPLILQLYYGPSPTLKSNRDAQRSENQRDQQDLIDSLSDPQDEDLEPEVTDADIDEATLEDSDIESEQSNKR